MFIILAGYSLVAMPMLLIVVTSLNEEQRALEELDSGSCDARALLLVGI